MLGFRFAPRVPNLAARRLHLFEGPEPGPDIAPLLAAPIDERLVTDHWTDVLRLAASIRTGVTRASAMLARLGSYPRANGLALALREIGRVERTLFTLDWIEDPEERRRATREMNKDEAENALKRAIFFHRAGRLRDHGLQAQGHRASALNLVVGAIVLWNMTYLEAAIRHLERQGRPVPPDLLQHLSPLGWQHINLTGDYLWTDPPTQAGQRRPLRRWLTQPKPHGPKRRSGSVLCDIPVSADPEQDHEPKTRHRLGRQWSQAGSYGACGALRHLGSAIGPSGAGAWPG
nr:Tn3 family transposase [Rubellimicrobium aerolatum]